MLLALLLPACAFCDDLAAQEAALVADTACTADDECQLVSVNGCRTLCSRAISTRSDARVVMGRLAELRAEAERMSCGCAVADCVPVTRAVCVAGTCEAQ